ncbi:MAG: discoidin domain-containing protein, partial [Paludibacter sp.]|nr:discoidin domain-containing protein [Paludibacter sp.]
MKKKCILLSLLALPFLNWAQGLQIDRTAWTVVSVDNFEAGYEGTKAIDGDVNTFWHTSFNSPVPLPHNIVIDMGTVQQVSSFGILPRTNSGNVPKNCIIYVKQNVGDAWTQVANGATDAYSNTLKTFTFSAINARFVKFEINSDWGATNLVAIAEIYAYFSVVTTQCVPVDKTNWHVIFVNSFQDANYDGSKAIDGDINTMWHTVWSPVAPAPPHTIEIDMGATNQINCVKLLSRTNGANMPNLCVISVKQNVNDTWVEVTRGNTVAFPTNEQSFYFEPVNARYLKITILSVWYTNFSAIAEINAYSNCKYPQIFEFNLKQTKDISTHPFQLNVTSNSGLPVITSIISGPAIIENGIITLTGNTGSVLVGASQAGDNTWAEQQETQIFYVIDSVNIFKPTPQLPIKNSNWVATDALNRDIVTFNETGIVKPQKFVGVFYLLWLQGGSVYDNTKIMNGQGSWGPEHAFHFWSEPEADYYHSEDPWVIRRNMQMLADAGVDFIYIDMTNGYTYMNTLLATCKVMSQMRSEGIPVPYIMFWLQDSQKVLYTEVYQQFYLANKYPELWFKWREKPVIMFRHSDTDPSIIEDPDIQKFFTIRWAWPGDYYKPSQKSWCELFTNINYSWETDPAVPESYVVYGAGFANGNFGRSYDLKTSTQPVCDSKGLTSVTDQGLMANYHWENALKINPEVILYNGFNEWLAQRFINKNNESHYLGGKPVPRDGTYFVDEFNQEFSRDIEPMKGGNTDSYYYQFVDNVRKFKGMEAPEAQSIPKSIAIDGAFTEWTTVTPTFYDYKGDTEHRNFRGYDPAVTLINNTGRNDIIESKITYDNLNIFAYVKTVNNLTAYSDPNWMLLFIDADRNKSTGWEGYDYVINLGLKSANQTTIKQWDGKKWTNEVVIPYFVVGNQ